MNFLLCKILYDLKGACTCMTHLREILHEVNWITKIVECIIKSCPLLTRDKICIVFYSSFLLIKCVSHALFVMASSSTPASFISWRLTVSLNPTFCADKKFKCWCGRERILIPAYVASVPWFIQQETIPLLVSAQKETHLLHLINLELLLLRWCLVSIHFDELIST